MTEQIIQARGLVRGVRDRHTADILDDGAVLAVALLVESRSHGVNECTYPAHLAQ